MLKITEENKEHRLVNAKKYVKKRIPIRAIQMEECFTVDTREGSVWGDKGDWLAEGVEGEVYPIGKTVFAKTYEESEP